MKRLALKRSVLSVCAALASHANAMDITTYERHRAEPTGSQNRGLQRIYLVAVGEGFKWSNAALSSRKQTLLFCAPAQPALVAENYAQLIDDALVSNRAKYVANEMPIEAVLLFELQTKLPCSAK